LDREQVPIVGSRRQRRDEPLVTGGGALSVEDFSEHVGGKRRFGVHLASDAPLTFGPFDQVGGGGAKLIADEFRCGGVKIAQSLALDGYSDEAWAKSLAQRMGLFYRGILRAHNGRLLLTAAKTVVKL
jgi:hypothetical protein